MATDAQIAMKGLRMIQDAERQRRRDQGYCEEIGDRSWHGLFGFEGCLKN